jgi:hypothetical protein
MMLRRLLALAVVSSLATGCATTSSWSCNAKTGFCSDVKGLKSKLRH